MTNKDLRKTGKGDEEMYKFEFQGRWACQKRTIKRSHKLFGEWCARDDDCIFFASNANLPIKLFPFS